MNLKDLSIMKKIGNGGVAAVATTVVLAAGVTVAGAVGVANVVDDSTATTTTAPTTTVVETTTTVAAPTTRRIEVPGLGTIEVTEGPNPQIVSVTPVDGVTAATETEPGEVKVVFTSADGTPTVVNAEFEDGQLQVRIGDDRTASDDSTTSTTIDDNGGDRSDDSSDDSADDSDDDSSDDSSRRNRNLSLIHI